MGWWPAESLAARSPGSRRERSRNRQIGIAQRVPRNRLGSARTVLLQDPTNQLCRSCVVDVMRRQVRLRPRARYGALITIVILCLADGVWSLPARGSVNVSRVSDATHRPGPVVKSATIGLGTCRDQNVTIRVVVARLIYAPSQPVDVLAVARNQGTDACTYSGYSRTGRGDALVGPCGAFPMSVVNSSGTSVWPGPYSCLKIGAARLAPGAQVAASGVWPKLVLTSTGSSPAPSGIYRLVIANTVSFVIKLR